MPSVNLLPRPRENPEPRRFGPPQARLISTALVAFAVGAVVLTAGPVHTTFASPRMTSDPAGTDLPGALAIQADGLHGDSVRISFVPPAFAPESGVTYQYRVEGLDLDWRRLSADRSMTYPEMASGTYALAVHAVDTRSRVRTPVANVRLTLVPPIWQSVWFLLSTAAVVIGATGIAFRRRTRREVELANVRTTIAMELHDDIGANLARVAVLSELVRRQRPSAAAVDTQLSTIARIARDSVNGMSDIVWAIDPERDRLVDVVRRMRQHAEDTTAESGIALTFDAGAAPGTAVVPMDVRRDVFLIFKEAVTNAARHSRCTRMAVTVRSTGRQLSLDVTDNGIGFDPDNAASGNGLTNMQRRARNIGAVLTVRTSPNAGSTVHLELTLKRQALFWPDTTTPRGFAEDGARGTR
jgi:signal transduction histidine kinase